MNVRFRGEERSCSGHHRMAEFDPERSLTGLGSCTAAKLT
jgi:hypothetical protein